MLAQRREALVDPCIGDLMTARPVVVSAGDRIAVAAERFRAGRLRHLPVLDDDRLVGVLTLTQLLQADPSAPIAAVMSRTLWTAAPTVGIRQACALLVARDISCLPVLDDGLLVGILTRSDALRFVLSLLEREPRPAQRGPTVGQLMGAGSTEVTAATTPLDEAWRHMRAADARYLPVMCGDAVIGLLGERDVLRASAGEPDGAHALLVADAMSPGVRLVRDEYPAWEAARLLSQHRAGALVVLRDLKLRGVLTAADFLRGLLRARA